MATQFVQGIPLRLAVAQARVFLETVLTVDQLIDSPNGGIGNAVACFLTDQVTNGDTVTLHNDTDGSETYTFLTFATSAPGEVQIGANIDATLLNLAAAIKATSSFWDSSLATSLDQINDGLTGTVSAGYVVLIWRQVPISAGDNDRIYGTLAVPPEGRIVNFGGEIDYLDSINIQLPASDPATANFGFGREQGDLIPSERHAVRVENQTWLWDANALAWLLASGEGTLLVIRQFAVGVQLLDLVYQSGSGIVDRADASGIATGRALGFVRALNEPDPGFCEVQYGGDLDGFTGLTPGKVYIASLAPGEIVAEDDTANPNYPDGTGEVIQIAGVADSATVLMVAGPSEIKELST